MRLEEEQEKYKERLSKMLLAEADASTGGSMRKLVRIAGIHHNSMQSYVAQDSFPGTDNRKKIARRLFGISLEELDARIEDRPVKRVSRAEDICREIRQLDDREFLEVYEAASREAVDRLTRLVGQP